MLVDAHTHMELKLFPSAEGIRSEKDLPELLASLGSSPTVLYGLEPSLSLSTGFLKKIKKPLLFVYRDGHRGLLTDSLRKLLGVKKSVLKEKELWSVVKKLRPKPQLARQLLLKALEEARKQGLSEIHDYVDEYMASLYLSLERDLPLRVVLMPYYEERREVLGILNRSAGFLEIGWVKVFADGSISSRTAYLKEPYSDVPTKGRLLTGKRDLVRMIREVESEGLRLSVHAIGDGALEVVLEAFGEASPRFRYHRIEHAELITQEMIKKAKALGVLLCMQPNFSCTYREVYERALGRNRAGRINPFHEAYKAGADLIFGTDMMPFDVHYARRCAEERLPGETVEYLFGGWKREKDYVNLY